MRRITFLILVFVIACGRAEASRYDMVQIGMTRAQAVAILGNPISSHTMIGGWKPTEVLEFGGDWCHHGPSVTIADGVVIDYSVRTDTAGIGCGPIG